MSKVNNVIVLNLGSTSFKFKLFDFAAGEKVLATGEVESIGSPEGAWSITIGEKTESGRDSFPLHGDAFALCLGKLTEYGALETMDSLDAVGYKAVHCGALKGAQLVDDRLIELQEHFCSFAPAHNPIYIAMMKQVKERYPSLPQVAYFETSFHATIPDERVTYGVPYEWKEKYGIRRYGFHGSSHSYIGYKMAELEPECTKVVSVHLGGSSSICAIKNGESVASSMGATPQSGIFHNNRVGDFDVFCIPELVNQYGSLDAVMKELSKNGGFLGVSGVSNDLRDVIAAADEGNERAKLAIDTFVDGIVGYVGMFTAFMGGLDAITFTGGIGQYSHRVRSAVLAKLAFMGITVDEDKRESSKDGMISTADSKVKVYVLKTNEELMVARKAIEFLSK